MVEDDPDIAQLIEMNLSLAGYTVAHESAGDTGLKHALEKEVRLVLLDLTLPNLDGLEICRQVHQSKPLLPIIIITSRTDEVDRILGFELGADDYLSKPFNPRELVARVKAILRRTDLTKTQLSQTATPPAASSNSLSFGEIRIDTAAREVFRGTKKVALTATEYDLLYIFASNPGRVFERDQLLELVWGYQAEGYARNVDCHVSRLRTKLEPSTSNPIYIRTVHAVGYRFCRPEELTA